MFFTGQSLETTKELESILGKYQYLDDKGAKVVKPLMTNDEIRTLKSNKALLICGNYPPILAKLKLYYKRLTFRNNSSISYQTENTNEDYHLEILPINSGLPDE